MYPKGIPPVPEIFVGELIKAFGYAGIQPTVARDVGATVEWLSTFATPEEAERAVGKPFRLRGLEVKLAPYCSQGPKAFNLKHTGVVTTLEIAEAVHAQVPSRKFGLWLEKWGTMETDRRVLVFDEPPNFTKMSLFFTKKNFKTLFHRSPRVALAKSARVQDTLLDRLVLILSPFN